MKKIFTKKIVLLVIAVFSLSVILVFWRASKKEKYDFIQVKRGNLVQEVSVTGKIRPAESLELAFESSGRVSRIYFDVGQKVRAFQKIAELDKRELLAQLSQKQAELAAEQAQLQELQQGTRSEELAAARTGLASAEKSLADAQANLEAVSNKAQADLDSVYNSVLLASQKAATSAKTSLFTLTDIQYNHATLLENGDVSKAKASAVLVLLGQAEAGKWTTTAIAGLTGGAFGQVQKALDNPVYTNIDTAVSQTDWALQQVKKSLDSVPLLSELSSTEKTNLSTEKSNVAAEIVALAAKEQAVLVQKTTNAYNLSAAQAGLNSAQNSLNSATDTLRLKEAGSTTEQIAVQQARVDSAQASVRVVQANLVKSEVVSPIDGTLTRKDVETGESASPGQAVFSLSSDSLFEIEIKVPEVDVAKLKIGDSARVVLDAFGPDTVLQATVTTIEPAEVLVEGVPTYKTILTLAGGDERIKPGMTADVDVLTAKKENVLSVPQRLVFSKNGDKFVRFLGQDNKISETKVKTGLRGSSGEIEILEGLKEGDKVLLLAK